MQEAEVAKRSDQRTGRARVDNRPENAGEFPHSAVPGSLDERQVERVLATARALLAGALGAAITFASDRSPHGRYYWLIISGYCVYCLGLIVLYRMQPIVWGKGRIVVHIADLIWA